MESSMNSPVSVTTTGVKPGSATKLPAYSKCDGEAVTHPATHRWSSLTCCVVNKVWLQTQSILIAASGRYPVGNNHHIAKPVSRVYIICLLLAHIICVSSSDTNTCSPKMALQVIRYQNCVPKRLLNFVCSGNCQSYSKVDPNDPTFIQHNCKCCQVGDSTLKRVQLSCPSPTGERRYINKTITVRFIRTCACRPCTVLPDIQTGEYL